jgi:hypothetical protein
VDTIDSRKETNALCGRSNYGISGEDFRDFKVKILGSKIKRDKGSIPAAAEIPLFTPSGNAGRGF